MNSESKLTDLLKIGVLKCPLDNKGEYLEVISANDMLVLDSLANINKYSLTNNSVKRNASCLQNDSKLKENTLKKPKVVLPVKTVANKILAGEMRKYENKSKEELLNEIEKLKIFIEELKKKDPKKEKLIDYFNLKKDKWINLSQEAVYENLKMFPQKANYERNSIKNIVEIFRLDKELIRYDEESEDFLN